MVAKGGQLRHGFGNAPGKEATDDVLASEVKKDGYNRSTYQF